MKNKIKRKIKVIAVIFVSFLIIFSNFTQAQAEPNNNDKYHVKEKQLLDKIKILHDLFPTKIDEAALLATLSHRGTLTSYINDSYIPNFKKDDFIENVNETFNFIRGIGAQTATEADQLLAATIVMLDSSGWFNPFDSYSDEKYQKALAGNHLVGNLTEGSIAEPLGIGLNALFCTVGAVSDTMATPIQFGVDAATGSGDTFLQRKASRYLTMFNICDQGYIGGTYPSVITMEDQERKQLLKDKYAEEIINLAKEFRHENSNFCVVNPSSYGDFTSWKQYDSKWKDTAVGGGGTIGDIGCLATSVAIQIARSGTALTGLSNGFTPKEFVETLNDNNGFTSGGEFQWQGQEDIASNWKYANVVSTNISNTKDLATTLAQELSTGAEDKYQKFIVLQIHHSNSSQHWVAVDSVSTDSVTIFDPGSEGKTLDDNYSGWVVDSYKVMYATDVPFGTTGSTSTSSDNLCTGSGGSLEDLMIFINNYEGGTTCNNGTGYTTSTLPNDPGGLTASNGVTLGTAKGYAQKAGYTESDIESEYRSGCPNKEKMDKVKMAILQYMYDEVGDSATEKGVTLSEIEHLALTSVRYGGYGMDRDILDKIKAYGNDSYEVFHCFVTLGCGFGNAAYMDGLVNRRAGEYELFRTGNLYAKNVGKGYNYYQGITNKTQLEHYMSTDWPTGEAPQ